MDEEVQPVETTSGASSKGSKQRETFPSYPFQLNLAGRLHWRLSQQRIRQQLKDARSVRELVACRSDAFRRAVRLDVLRAVAAGRQLPQLRFMTRTVDGMFGTVRQDPMHEPQTIGCLGAALSIPAMVAGMPLGMVAGVCGGPKAAEFGGCLPFWGLTQLSALLGLLPKAAATALLAGAALPVAVGHGTVAALKHRRVADDHQPGQPCRNATTLVAMEPLESVEAAFFFRCSEGYGFDIRELVAWIQSSRQWLHPYTLQQLSWEDRARLYRHPSRIGRPLHSWMAVHRLGYEEVSAATRHQLEMLADALGPGFLSNKSADARKAREALTVFVEYHEGLSKSERAALDAALNCSSGEGFERFLRGVVTGQLCSMGFAEHLARCLNKLQAVPPRCHGMGPTVPST